MWLCVLRADYQDYALDKWAWFYHMAAGIHKLFSSENKPPLSPGASFGAALHKVAR